MGSFPLRAQGLETMISNDETFMQAMDQWRPTVPRPPTYRLYHDAHGVPLYYSMDLHDDPWIEVTCEQYHASSFKVRVEDGKLCDLPPPRYPKLVPSDNGTPCHVQNVAIVVNHGDCQYWSQNA